MRQGRQSNQNPKSCHPSYPCRSDFSILLEIDCPSGHEKSRSFAMSPIKLERQPPKRRNVTINGRPDIVPYILWYQLANECSLTVGVLALSLHFSSGFVAR